MNKSLITNLAALGLVFGGFFSPWFPEQLRSAGLFALSGALTNWLAVHMLFEKVPLFYGSGVILIHFEDLKRKIRELIIAQFFRSEDMSRFLDRIAMDIASDGGAETIIDLLDWNKIFDELKTMVFSGNLGGFLGMFGGEAALEPFRPKFHTMVREAFCREFEKPEFHIRLQEALKAPVMVKKVQSGVESMIDERLEELTPVMVKDMLHDIMRKHLGWLVVWGGVLGCIIGLAASFYRRKSMKKLCLLILCFAGWMVYAQDDSTVGDKVGKAVDDTVNFFSDVFNNSKDFVNSLDTKKLKLDFQALSNRLKRSIDVGFTELKNMSSQDSQEKLRRHLNKVHRAMDDFIQKTSNEGRHRQDIDRILQDAKLQIRELKKKAAEPRMCWKNPNIWNRQRKLPTFKRMRNPPGAKCWTSGKTWSGNTGNLKNPTNS